MATTIKPLLCLLLLCAALSGKSQTALYGIWEDSTVNYHLVSVDPQTAAITTLGGIPFMQAFVAGNRTTVDPDNGHYVFVGFTNGGPRLYVMDLVTGAILHDNAFPSNVVGFEYHCEDGRIYGLHENNNLYDLVTVDVTTGAISTINNIPTVTAYVGSSFSLDEKRGLYSFMGLNSTNIVLYSIDISTGNIVYNQQFPDNVVGLNQNCPDSTMYGLWEDGTDYKLEAVDPATGTHTTINTLSGIDPGWIGETATIDSGGTFIYHGFVAGNASLISIDVSNGVVLNTVALSGPVHGLEMARCCTPMPIDTPVAAFSASSQNIAVGTSVDFTDLSTNAPTLWDWSFPGATVTSSTDQHPTGIQYNTAGCYDVQLIVSNTAGSDTELEFCYINVYDPNGMAEMTERLALSRQQLDDELQLRWEWGSPLQLELYDLAGQRILVREGLYHQIRIDLQNLPKGIYMYALSDNGQVLVADKFVR